MPFRLLLLGIMLANRWLDDNMFSNKTWFVIFAMPAFAGLMLTPFIWYGAVRRVQRVLTTKSTLIRGKILNIDPMDQLPHPNSMGCWDKQKVAARATAARLNLAHHTFLHWKQICVQLTSALTLIQTVDTKAVLISACQSQTALITLMQRALRNWRVKN